MWELAILGIVLFIEGIVILMAIKELSTQIEQGLEDLDTNFGLVIKNIVENYMPGDGVNPIQIAFAEILKNAVPQRTNVIETIPSIPRSENGQFE